MSGTFVCPRCSASMKIAKGLAEHYAFCPKCEGRVWVPGDVAPIPEETKTEPVSAKPPQEAVPSAPAPPPQGPSDPTGREPSEPTAPPPVSAPAVPMVEAPPTAPPPVAPTSIATSHSGPRRVAKFITADVAHSRLELANDGELPQLQLTEMGGKKQKKAVRESAGQWRIVLLVCGSLVLSVLLLMVGPSESGRSSNSRADDARAIIGQRYIGKEDGELETYQLYLRKALLAHSHGDIATERRYYRKVLHLLRAEDLDLDPKGDGLTGLRHKSSDGRLPSDSQLDRHLSTLLNAR